MDSMLTIASHRWEVQIDPAHGANLACARYRGRDVLCPRSAGRDNPYLAGAPLLLPANRTAGGRFSFAGKTYALPVNEPSSGAHLHGELHRQCFRVRRREVNCVQFEYENVGTIYPFPFLIQVAYRVDDNCLYAGYRIYNPSDAAMPVTFALHTTFEEPEWFRVPLAACQERDARNLPTGRLVPLSAQELSYTTGSPSRGRVISGYYRSAGDTAQIGPHFRYQAFGFDHWILFNGGGTSGLLCVEPQLGAVNALNDPENCPTISGKSSLSLQTRLFWVP